ncbi:MAG: hypothetical protein MUE40_15695 [Anaerolineae bacterium]|jgi:hypothetical protein|nr:hypothetical protein [Anaerolineae bacterium]
MKMRAVLMSLLLTIVLLMASVASAQDTCFGLAEADCTAIAEATNNTLAAASAFTQEFSLSFSVTGIPDSEDLTFNVTGAGPVMMSTASSFPLNLALPMNVSFSVPGQAWEGAVEVRVVDGIAYVQNPENGEWAGLDLGQALSDPSALGLPVNPADLAGAADPAALGLDADAMTQIGSLVTVPGFLTYVRGGDTYTFTANLGTLLQSAEFSQVAQTLSTALAENPDTAQGGMLLTLLPMLLSDGIITVVQGVDPSLNAVTDLTFTTDATLNLGMMTGDTSAPPVVISLNFNVRITEVGGTYEIVAPEGAVMQSMGQ